MPLIPWIVEALLAALEWLITTQAGQWVLSLLVFFGLSISSQHFVVEPLLDQLKGYVAGAGSGSGSFGSICLAWLGVLNFDKAITMVCSAVATKFSVTAAKAFLTKKAG